MAAQLPTWQVGDTVYALRLDPTTGRYRVHGEGRVVRIGGGTLHLATTKGPKTWPATAWPAFRTRGEGEAYVAEHPTPTADRGQMAHYGPSTAPPADTYECLRCEQLRDGIEPIVPGHALRCPYRGTGRDQEREG